MIGFIQEIHKEKPMGKAKSAPTTPAKKGDNNDRNNGKAFKKRPKVFDKTKRRLVTKEK